MKIDRQSSIRPLMMGFFLLFALSGCAVAVGALGTVGSGVAGGADYFASTPVAKTVSYDYDRVKKALLVTLCKMVIDVEKVKKPEGCKHPDHAASHDGQLHVLPQTRRRHGQPRPRRPVPSLRQLRPDGAAAAPGKIEGVRGHEDVIGSLVEGGVPVMGHLGLTPQSVHAFGGFRVQAKDRSAVYLVPIAVFLATSLSAQTPDSSRASSKRR